MFSVSLGILFDGEVSLAQSVNILGNAVPKIRSTMGMPWRWVSQLAGRQHIGDPHIGDPLLSSGITASAFGSHDARVTRSAVVRIWSRATPRLPSARLGQRLLM